VRPRLSAIYNHASFKYCYTSLRIMFSSEQG
jgi:hypothetical protein